MGSSLFFKWLFKRRCLYSFDFSNFNMVWTLWPKWQGNWRH